VGFRVLGRTHVTLMLSRLPVDEGPMHAIREDLESIARRILDAGPAAMEHLVLACMRKMAKEHSRRGLPESSPETWEETKQGLLYEASGHQWNMSSRKSPRLCSASPSSKP